MNKLAILFTIPSLIISACGNHDSPSNTTDEAATHRRYDELLSEQLAQFAPLPSVTETEKNPSSTAKIALGHVLYYDTRLSKDGNNSCNSCHNLATFGVDNLPTSPGDAGQNGDRNSPTTLNAAIHTSQFWDGRALDVEEQAGMPILNPVEMAIPNEAFLIDRLKNIELYKRMFAEAYPESSNPFTYENLRYAIAAFERQLLTPSRVDRYLQGDKSALSLEEKKGMLSFALIGCTSCHNGAALGGGALQRFGVHKPYWEATGSTKIDRGRMSVTNDSLDLYLFKVPTLRNITDTKPYFHDGSVADLSEAIRIMADIQLDYKINSSEVKNIAAFLTALKGEVPAEYKVNPLQGQAVAASVE